MTDSNQAPDTTLEDSFYAEGCHILEISNSDADPALSMTRIRIPSTGATQRHRLNGITERYLVEAGTGHIEIGDVRSNISAGDLIVIPSGESQRVRNTGSDDLTLLSLCTPRFCYEAYENLEFAGAFEGSKLQ